MALGDVVHDGGEGRDVRGDSRLTISTGSRVGLKSEVEQGYNTEGPPSSDSLLLARPYMLKVLQPPK